MAAKKKTKKAKKRPVAPQRVSNTIGAKLMGTRDKDLNKSTTIGPKGAARMKQGLKPGSGFLFKKRKKTAKKKPK